MTSEKRNLNSGTVALLFLGFGFLVVALGVGAYIHLEVMGVIDVSKIPSLQCNAMHFIFI